MIFELAIGLALLVWLAYWLRGYFPPVRRAFLQARQAFLMLQKMRNVIKNGIPNQNFPGADFSTTRGAATTRGKTVDVNAKTELKIVCPVCNDALSDAQVLALRSRSLRCPGSARVSRDCPFYGGRDLN
jgi:hypothetical protein